MLRPLKLGNVRSGSQFAVYLSSPRDGGCGRSLEDVAGEGGGASLADDQDATRRVGPDLGCNWKREREMVLYSLI